MSGGGPKVGRAVGVPVGGCSCKNGVSVGVKVTGVLVDVAKRSCVGIRVTVGPGVSVLGGGCGVGVATSCRMGDKAEQPLRNIPNRKVGINFFMEQPL